MKIFNLTDVSTPILEQRHLMKQTFAVADKDVAPGDSIDVEESRREVVLAQAQHLISCGALAVDKLPDSYNAGKQSVVEKKYEQIKETQEVEAPRTSPIPVEAPPENVSISEEPPRLPITDSPPARRRSH